MALLCDSLQTRAFNTRAFNTRAFNNVHRCILKLPPRSRASAMYDHNNIDSLETLLRKRTFTDRLEKK